jgi:hypothetical protein
MKWKVLCTGNCLRLFVVSVLFVLYSCADKNQDQIQLLQALDESLVRSNASIHKGTQQICSEFEEKLNEPASEYRAKTWYPKAMFIKTTSGSAINYIETLKSRLKSEADLSDDHNGQMSDNGQAVQRLFVGKNAAKELYKKLKAYEAEVFAVDSSLTMAFLNATVIISSAIDTIKIGQQHAFEQFFSHSSYMATVCMLSKLENNIKITENRMIQFCNNKVGSYDDGFRVYSVIIAQDKSYLQKGENLKITAGVGAFSVQPTPEITINGKLIPLDDNGTAVYKLKASRIAGTYSIPVQINFINDIGENDTIKQNIKYTVAKEPGQDLPK